ncbi:MAG: 50S ribosomal protein L29 [Candidatus Paceibacterota bacterium]|jgi:ribosomal protein L29
MKKDAQKTLLAKTTEELHALQRAAQEKFSQMRFDLRAGKTANLKDLRAAKKETAIISTIISQRKHE